MAEVRWTRQAPEDLDSIAEKLGGNAIVGMRFTTASIMAAASEILAYGTAVEIE